MISTKVFFIHFASNANISVKEIENANWLIDYPAIFNIKYKNDWLKIYLIDKKHNRLFKVMLARLTKILL